MKPAAATASISVLIGEAEIRDRVAALARDMAAALPPDFLIVAMLRGSFVFAADLIRALYAASAQPQVDFMTVSSYAGTQSTGQITVHRDIASDVEGRHVLLLDDILESGRTLSFARAELTRRGAAAVDIAVLLEKPGKRAPGTDVSADYVGFTIPDHFVVGYGLDWDNYHRELPFIGVIS